MSSLRTAGLVVRGVVLTAAICLVACNTSTVNMSPGDFTLDHPAGITLVVGQTVTEGCTLHGRFLNDTWTWISQDTSVATATASGGNATCQADIRGVSIGSTTVTYYFYDHDLLTSGVPETLPVTVVAGPPTVISIATSPLSPQATIQFGFTLTGTNFDPATIQVLGTGSGCVPCVIANASLTNKSATSAEGTFTAPSAGPYVFTVRNGSGATPSTSSATVTVAVAPIPHVNNFITTPAPAQARVSFAFTFFGSDFDPVASQVLVSGPGCLPSFCVVAETDMTARSTSSISGRFTASVAGNYQFSARNGAFGAPSNTYQINVIAAPTCLTPSVIADAFDVASTWKDSVTAASAGATDVTTWNTTGGNPQGYRGSVHTIPGVGSLSVIHRLESLSYNPATQGAIDHIDYSEDQKAISGAAVASQFFIQQGTTFYVTALPAFSSTAWTPATLTNLTVASFTPAGLNFGSTGGVMHFGYVRANSNTSTNTLTREHGIDNFAVTICH